MRPRLELILEDNTNPAPSQAMQRRLGRVVRQLLREENIGSEVCLVLTQSLRALKKQHWQEDRETDVLTFPQWEPGDAFVPPVLGDILIALPVAAQQAQAQGHDLETEVVVLAAHGLTHLLGHDHATPKDWQAFRTRQDRAQEILRGLRGQATRHARGQTTQHARGQATQHARGKT